MLPVSRGEEPRARDSLRAVCTIHLATSAPWTRAHLGWIIGNVFSLGVLSGHQLLSWPEIHAAVAQAPPFPVPTKQSWDISSGEPMK